MPSLRAILTAGVVACAPALTAHARAEQFVVQAGREWSSLASRLKAGDEIVLARGTHMPASFSGLEGSPFAPIVIRSESPNALAEIAADREAIKLVDCRHVRIERIASRGARRAGVLIESTKPGASLDVSISDVLVIGARGLAEESGIVARGVRELGIRRSRFENCVGCGILVDDCESVSIADVQIAARTDTAAACGIRFAGRVWSTLVERVQMAGPIATAFELGRSESTLHARAPAPPAADAAPSAAPAPSPPKSTAPSTTAPSSTPDAARGGSTTSAPEPLVRFLVISNVRLSGVHRLLDVGSAADTAVRNVTHREAHEEVYRLSPPPAGRPAAAVRMSECLLTWSPGALRRFGAVEGGADAKGFVLGPNLWWSSELPAALPLLGPTDNPFPGTIESPQVLDVEPKFDARSRLINAEAAGFGAGDQ